MAQAPSGHELPPPIQILQMVMGSWVSQITATVARLEIADHLASGARSSDELARLCDADPDSLCRLLRAASMLGLLREAEPKQFSLTPLGECLRSGAPGSLRDFVVAEAGPGHWLPWGHLYQAVKTGKPTTQATLGTDAWDYYSKNREEGAYFARGMSNLSAMVSAEVLAANYDFSSFQHVVDVGGSHGVMLAGILKAVPAAKGILFDRSDVIETGRAVVKGYGLGERLSQVAGDFLKEVSSGGDLYVLKSILHDWDDEKSTIILKNIHRASRPGTKIAVVEMLRPDVSAPSPVFLMDLNMLVMLGGRERSEKEFAALFSSAGFKLTRVVPTTGLFCLIEGERV